MTFFFLLLSVNSSFCCCSALEEGEYWRRGHTDVAHVANTSTCLQSSYQSGYTESPSYHEL